MTMLRRSRFLGHRDVSCYARDRSLELRGRLPSYGLWLPSRAIVAEVAGACPVLDRIDVVPMTARPWTGSDRIQKGTESDDRSPSDRQICPELPDRYPMCATNGARNNHAGSEPQAERVDHRR